MPQGRRTRPLRVQKNVGWGILNDNDNNNNNDDENDDNNSNNSNNKRIQRSVKKLMPGACRWTVHTRGRMYVYGTAAMPNCNTPKTGHRQRVANEHEFAVCAPNPQAKGRVARKRR